MIATTWEIPIKNHQLTQKYDPWYDILVSLATKFWDGLLCNDRKSDKSYTSFCYSFLVFSAQPLHHNLYKCHNSGKHT